MASTWCWRVVMTQHGAWGSTPCSATQLGALLGRRRSTPITMLCSGHWLETALDTVLGTGQHHAPLLTLALNGTRHSTPCSGLCSQHWLETVLEDHVGVGARHGTWGLTSAVASPHVSHAAMQPFHVEPRTTTDGRWLIDVSPLSTTFVFPCPRQTNGHPT